MTNNNEGEYLGRILKQRRVMIPLTLRGLAAISGTSSSHLGRIERGERFPSALILRKIAKPLGFEESELFSLAGFLSPGTVLKVECAWCGKDMGEKDGKGQEGTSHGICDECAAKMMERRLDPIVARVLAQEPVEVQRTVIGILSILKSIAKAAE